MVLTTFRNIMSLFRRRKDDTPLPKMKKKKSKSTLSDDTKTQNEVSDYETEVLSLLPIRDNIDYRFYRKKFKKNKIIEINDFLDVTFCDKLYDFLNYKMPEEWWYHIACQHCENLPLVYTINTFENVNRINYYHHLANVTFMNNCFSYSFYRTVEDHYKTCNCEICEIINIIKSRNFINAISRLTDIKLTKVTEIFVNRFNEGMFISPHNDLNKGRIGFILNLTNNWMPEYGGIFNISVKKNDYFYTKQIIPTYNNLVLFYIPEPYGLLNYISHVSPGVKEKRLSITGWFE